MYLSAKSFRLAVVASLAACGVNRAGAQVANYIIFYTGYANQLNDVSAEAPGSWGFFAGLYTQGPDDAGETTLTVPGQPPVPMIRNSPYDFYLNGAFATEAELMNAYPAGDYVMSISGGTLGDLSDTLPRNDTWWPGAQPSFTDGTYTAMQAIDPTQDLVVRFNTYDPAPAADTSLTFFGAFDYAIGNYAFYSSSPQPVGEFTIPANTLTPNSPLSFTIWHSSRQEVCCPGFGGTALRTVAFDYATTATGFTTEGGGGTPCPADFNQDGGIDGADVSDFFAAWENGDPSADVNQDGGVDGADVTTFFAAWENGGC